MIEPHFVDGVVQTLDVHGATLAVESVGTGSTVPLVHGFPHTRVVWREVATLLADDGFRVVAPDLRGLGDSTRTAAGYDIASSAADLAAVIEHTSSGPVHAVGIDLGGPAVFALAATRPDLVATLTIVEATLGTEPGAEEFFAHGAPWWFGFHGAPHGLAERSVAGNEDAYIGFFLEAGSRRGIPTDMRSTLIDAYRGEHSLRAAFEYYRAMPANAQWISEWTREHRLRMPVLAIGGDTVGDATAGQLAPIFGDLRSVRFPDSGHIVCVDAPEATARAIGEHAGAPPSVARTQ